MSVTPFAVGAAIPRALPVSVLVTLQDGTEFNFNSANVETAAILVDAIIARGFKDPGNEYKTYSPAFIKTAEIIV